MMCIIGIIYLKFKHLIPPEIEDEETTQGEFLAYCAFVDIVNFIIGFALGLATKKY